MAINGWPVPVDTITENVASEGEMQRAYSGTAHLRRRAIKRKWNVKTKLMTQSDTETLRQMLVWTGQYFPFDSDLFSTKGLGPASGNYAPLLYGTAQDGSGAIVGQTRYSNAIVPGPATINALTNATSLTGDATQWTAGSGTTLGVSAGTTQGAVTANSISLTCSGGTTMSTYNSTAVAFSGAAASASIYVKGSVGSVTLALQTSGGTVAITSASVNLAAYPGQWQRISVILPVTSTTSYRLLLQVSGVSSGAVVYANAAQLEAAPFPSPWAQGGVARSASRALYTLPSDELLNTTGLTVMAWLGPAMLETGYTGNRTLFSLTDAVGHAKLVAFISPTDNNLYVTTQNYVAVYQAQMTFGAPLAGGVHHLALTFNFYPSPTPYLAAAYVDGVEQNTAYTFCGFETLASQFATLDIGSNNGLNFFSAAIDEFIFLPYIASGSLIAAVAGSTVAYGAQPRLWCTGDFADGNALSCLSSGVKLANSSFDLGDGTWQRGGGALTFDLQEV